jgi:hypothetical protein
VDASAASITKLKAQLNALKPTLGAGDLVTCVREAADLEAAKDKSAKVIVVITDGQRFGWHMDEAPLWTAIKTRVESAAIPSSVNLQLVGDPSLPTANLCINQIESQRQVIAINQPASFTAHVQNRGVEQSSPTLLRWQAWTRIARRDNASGTGTGSEHDGQHLSSISSPPESGR